MGHCPRTSSVGRGPPPPPRPDPPTFADSRSLANLEAHRRRVRWPGNQCPIGEPSGQFRHSRAPDRQVDRHPTPHRLHPVRPSPFNLDLLTVHQCLVGPAASPRTAPSIPSRIRAHSPIRVPPSPPPAPPDHSLKSSSVAIPLAITEMCLVRGFDTPGPSLILLVACAATANAMYASFV